MNSRPLMANTESVFYHSLNRDGQDYPANPFIPAIPVQRASIMVITKITLNHGSRHLPILQPPEFKAFGPEVDQKADFQAVRLQAVDGLGELNLNCDLE